MLNKIGFNNYRMKASLKSFLYKVYSRSTLKYGFENVYFNKKLINEIKGHEGTMIKRALYLPKYCSTTAILNALNIQPVDMLIKKCKLNFLLGLTKDKLTYKILEHINVAATLSD